jgi:hypothetical protein
VAALAATPGTVPPLVNCQYVQDRQPDGHAGRPAADPATHSGSAPNAVLSPVHARHHATVV